MSHAGKEEGEEEEEEVRLCDFGRWASWQTAPGSILLVPHSQRTKSYLATYELMDVLQQDDSNSGANYAMEMRTFLNKEDINVPLPSPSSRGDEGEGTPPVFFKRRAKRATIPSDEEDEDFLPAKKQLSVDSGTTVGSAKSAGVLSGSVSAIPVEEEEKLEGSSSKPAGHHGTPLDLSSLADCDPDLCDFEGSSPRGGGEAGTDVPLPPSFSELDWLDGVTCTQTRSQLTASPGMASSPRKVLVTSTPLRATAPSSPHTGCNVLHEAVSFQPLASSTVERAAARKTNVFKVPLAVSRRLSLSPSTQDTDLVSPELSRSDVGIEVKKKGEKREDEAEEEEVKEEAIALVTSTHVPIPAATENLSTTVSCEDSVDSDNYKKDCEQECDVVSVVGESDMEEEGFIDPSTSKLLCTSPSVDQDMVRGSVLTPHPVVPSCPASVPTHPGGVGRIVTPEEESPLNIQRRKRRRRMHRRRDVLCSQFSPSPRQGGSLAHATPGSTPIGSKTKCHIVVSDDGSDGDFESPLRKPEKRARARFGNSDEDRQIEEPAAVAVADSDEEEEDGIESCSDDSAENWQKCERKLSRKMTKEFLVDEAELSPDNIAQYSSDEPDDPDCYNYMDSFINDATMLTQVTPACKRGKGGKKSRRGDPSPNMMGMYRRFLRSPNDVLFGGKGQRGGLRAGQCRMVLSQRHGILRKYAKKAGFVVPFVSPDETVAPSSSLEETSGECEVQSQFMDDESSEAEEVQMLNYEEEEEEIEEEEVEEEEEELETQDPDEQAKEAAEHVEEEAFALEVGMDEMHPSCMPSARRAESTGPFEVEHPSHALSVAGGGRGVEHSIDEDKLYHEVLDDLLADDIPLESFNSPSAVLPFVATLGTSKEPGCVKPPDKMSGQSPVEQRNSGHVEEKREGVEGFPKFRILRPGMSSQGEHTENVLTSVERTSLCPVGPGIVVRMGGMREGVLMY